MAFNSLNTIDKDCVTVASSGRKISVWLTLVPKQETGPDRESAAHSQDQSEMQKWGHLDFFLPVNVASQYLFSLFLYFWL